MEGWQQKKISDLGKVITGKTPPTSISEYFGSGYKFITPTDLDFFNYFITNTDREVTELARTKFKNYFLPPHSISFTCIGNTVGKACMNKDYVLTNQQINSIVPNKDNDSKFIYYFLNSIIESIRSIAGGTATPIINKSTFGNLKIVIPPLPTQRKIASILSAYDDLIENNLKRIKLLEEKAQLTYEEWFVRMKFPGHETTPINKETGLPEGWEKVKLSQIAEFLNGFAFKPKHLGAQGMPVIKIKEMKNGVVDDTPRNNGNDIADKYLVENGDILFSWSATLEVVIWKYETGLLNQHLFKVTPNVGFGKSYVFLSTKNSLPIFDLLTTGATMKHIKRKELDFVKLNKPPKAIMIEFEGEVSPVLTKVLNLSKQNQLLKEARDILLPRLMTGMIDVEQMKLENLQPTTA
jgi:type I restriction enzyme S subunit